MGCWEPHPNPFSMVNPCPRIACTAEEPEAVPSGMLLDVAKYLGSLQYNVWKKMLDTITAGEEPGMSGVGFSRGWEDGKCGDGMGLDNSKGGGPKGKSGNVTSIRDKSMDMNGWMHGWRDGWSHGMIGMGGWIHGSICESIDGWKDGGTDESMDGEPDGQIHRWIHGGVHRVMDPWKDPWKDPWMDGGTDGSMDGGTDGQIHGRIYG